jgi:Xaa-Pro dipeptidase
MQKRIHLHDVLAAPQRGQVEIPVADLRARIAKLQDAMKSAGIKAAVMESGAGMGYLTNVRWGRSERTFAVVLPASGEPGWVVPGFEEMRARELIHVGTDIRIWEEDESPYQRIVEILRDRGVTAGRVAFDDTTRFFIFDGVRKQAPKLEYVSAKPIFTSAGVPGAPAGGRRGQ